MTPRKLVTAGLRHYWRTNLAVIAGVATAVAVLAGALLVGDSVRGSLRDLVLQRLGRTDRFVTSTGFFREALAGELKQDEELARGRVETAPLIVMQGVVADGSSGRRASRVQVYGVDDRFWAFHGVHGRTGPVNREAFISRALAADIGAAEGGTVLVRVERPSAIPIESLHGRKDDAARTLRLSVRAVLDRDGLGEFSIAPQQGEVRAVFVPLDRLQQDVDQPKRINAILVGPGLAGDEPLSAALKRHARVDDYGLKVRTLDAQNVIAVEADAGFIDRRLASAVSQAAADSRGEMRPVLTYLANAMRSGDREVPYSLVTAIDLRTIAPSLASPPGGDPPVVINEWAARDLGVAVGDPLTLDYYVWEEPGLLVTKSAGFTIAAIVPIAGAAADRDLAPSYPGITGSETVADWDPPFPIDLKRVRPADEEYWKSYRTTPKAFVPLDVGQRLWGSARYGDRTSIRIAPAAGQTLADSRALFSAVLATTLEPTRTGFSILRVRANGLAASRGATNFGEYFVYFSFFLVASALVLAALFFRLGVEQRAREVGLLRAVGYTTPMVRRLFTMEGLLLAVAGSAIGIAGAVGYGALMMAGLRTWWSGAVGTRDLALHVSPLSLLAGAAGAVIAATVCIWWTLRGLSRLSERSLLSGQISDSLPSAAAIADRGRQPRRSREAAKSGLIVGATGLLLMAATLIAASIVKTIDAAGAFFGAGGAVLIACLCLIAWRLRRVSASPSKPPSIPRLGLRSTTERPGRSVLAIAVIASAVFVLISVDAFRRGSVDATDRRSGTGGYPLMVDLMVPVVQDPNGADGREALGLDADPAIAIEPFRVRPGEDTSCLNLYEPTNPRILGVTRHFIDAGRFSFQSSAATTDAARANPWLLLTESQTDGAIPIAADANSMTYVLHKSIGDEVVLTQADKPIRLKLVAALADSVFQGELLMSEENFIRLFPGQQGYRFLMIDAPADRAAAIGAAIEKGASDLGADAVPTPQRLAEFHAVENTYLSTFQTLGGLGLLVGTVGLAAVLLRNVLERRRELALLRAVGYSRGDLFTIIASENVVLLGWGLVVGAVSALVAIAPAALERGARLPITTGGWLLLLAVVAAGLISSVIATRAALRMPLVGSLRSE
jgi:ABC-type lipoprotein release transport system permease subunit